jgi:cell division protein FtsI/penicillin-binding protein 2
MNKFDKKFKELMEAVYKQDDGRLFGKKWGENYSGEIDDEKKLSKLIKELNELIQQDKESSEVKSLINKIINFNIDWTTINRLLKKKFPGYTVSDDYKYFSIGKGHPKIKLK